MTVAINGRFLLNSFGGVRRFATELAMRLSELRDDVVIVAPRAAESHALPDVRMEKFGRTSGPVWEQIELPRWLARHGSPVLINPANIAPVLYANQISVLHDIAPAIRPGDFTRLFRAQWQLTVRLGMLRRGRDVVTVSDVSRLEISDYFRTDPQRIDVIYNGADSLVGFGEVAPAVPAGQATFLTFGRHGTAKNSRIVIDALGALPDSSIGIRFVGELDPGLRPYATHVGVPADRIHWRGRVSDAELGAEYRAATAFIWPSLHEGFGIPPLEAQSAGVPVIASDIPINREILGESALYFPASDKWALATLMTRLAADAELRATLAERGKANAARFTWAGTAHAWNDLLDRRTETS